MAPREGLADDQVLAPGLAAVVLVVEQEEAHAAVLDRPAASAVAGEKFRAKWRQSRAAAAAVEDGEGLKHGRAEPRWLW